MRSGYIATFDMETLEWISRRLHDYIGPVEKCCGPSGNEKILSGQQATFSQQLAADYNTQFGKQSSIINSLNNILSPIAQAGPSQAGFSPQQLAAENTQALDTTGANYASAARAVNGQLAGKTGDSGLESGVAQQVQGSIASSAAGQLSNEELGITNANYAQGRQNWQTALTGENALAGLTNPEGYANPAISANNSAFSDANTINTQQNAKDAAIASGIVGVGLAPFTGGASLAGLSSSLNAGSGGGSSGGFSGLSLPSFGGGGIPGEDTSGNGGVVPLGGYLDD